MTTYTAQPAPTPNPDIPVAHLAYGYGRVSKQGRTPFYITHDSRYHAPPAMTLYTAQPAPNPNPDVPVAHLAYGYDRDSLPTYREDLQAQATPGSPKYDELYGRDGLNRLDNYQRGELNATHTAITSGGLEFEQDWALDQVANWTAFDQDDNGDGTDNLAQTRTHNKSNGGEKGIGGEKGGRKRDKYI